MYIDQDKKIVSFFDLVQRLYSLFSAFTHRWNVLTSSLGKNHIVVKCLSDTRWSAHFDAVTALHGGFEKSQDALDALAVNADQEWNKRREAEGLSKKMEKLETIFLTIPWNYILERVNKTSKILQSKDVDILVAIDLLKSPQLVAIDLLKSPQLVAIDLLKSPQLVAIDLLKSPQLVAIDLFKSPQLVAIDLLNSPQLVAFDLHKSPQLVAIDLLKSPQLVAIDLHKSLKAYLKEMRD